jgi:Zn-dependent protease with chaperone function
MSAMKYVPKDMGKAADVSVSTDNAFRDLAKLAAMAIALVAALYFFVGFIADVAVSRISVENEKKLFGGIKVADEREMNTPELKRLLPIFDKLKSRPETPPLDYYLFLINEPKPNAVAVPGGGIGVTKGLLKTLKKDDVAVAFVIGHEFGHFKNRDHLRGMGRAVGLQVIMGLIFGNSDLGGVLVGGVADMLKRGYSRGQESKADKFGLLLVYKTYGHTNGTTRLFEILEKQSRTPSWAYMFATHPDTGKRIRDMKKYAEELEKK